MHRKNRRKKRKFSALRHFSTGLIVSLCAFAIVAGIVYVDAVTGQAGFGETRLDAEYLPGSGVFYLKIMGGEHYMEFNEARIKRAGKYVLTCLPPWIKSIVGASEAVESFAGGDSGG